MRTPIQILDEHAVNYRPDVIHQAREWLERWDEWKYGKSPRVGAAAAAFYAQVVVGIPTSQRVHKKEVASDFGVSERAMTRWCERVLDGEPKSSAGYFGTHRPRRS